jgi:hypothetical protein
MHRSSVKHFLRLAAPLADSHHEDTTEKESP